MIAYQVINDRKHLIKIMIKIFGKLFAKPLQKCLSFECQSIGVCIASVELKLKPQ